MVGGNRKMLDAGCWMLTRQDAGCWMLDAGRRDLSPKGGILITVGETHGATDTLLELRHQVPLSLLPTNGEQSIQLGTDRQCHGQVNYIRKEMKRKLQPSLDMGTGDLVKSIGP